MSNGVSDRQVEAGARPANAATAPRAGVGRGLLIVPAYNEEQDIETPAARFRRARPAANMPHSVCGFGADLRLWPEG